MTSGTRIKGSVSILSRYSDRKIFLSIYVPNVEKTAIHEYQPYGQNLIFESPFTEGGRISQVIGTLNLLARKKSRVIQNVENAVFQVQAIGQTS